MACQKVSNRSRTPLRTPMRAGAPIAETTEQPVDELGILVVNDCGIHVEPGDVVHFCIGQLEVEDGEILLDAFLTYGLGYGHNPPLNMPAQDNLSNRLPMTLSDLAQDGVGEDAVIALGERCPTFVDDAELLHDHPSRTSWLKGLVST